MSAAADSARPAAVGLVLAAGAGRRFGGPKALVEYRGVRLVDRTVRLLREGGCDLVVVVTGAAPLEVAGARVVHNEGWDSGMGSSLRVGLEAVAGRDVVVVPVDMPWLGAGAVRRVREAGSGDGARDGAGAGDGADLAVATYGGRWGHPVLLGGRHHPGVIASAVGDVGARRYLRAHSASVVEVPCDDTGSPRDVDVPGDLEAPAARNTGDTRGFRPVIGRG
ncbi:nucleotidyltransferase family protein [Dietzia psychralcaliphila]|uniref:Molybdopterin-guanine dinucleotide biosynthesis protein A n=1 Tax=Dietzia psychralcaliphila TaxID=139021 RepID=A0AAD0JVI7_9ACTN|nr:nucleotidyltransferase family protein [Dietzia psychralcaliphila]AWH97474.1 molybdopterin-guanine dinucleotide biosynthesis protein A [Dietzia psychralcaliphila]